MTLRSNTGLLIVIFLPLLMVSPLNAGEVVLVDGVPHIINSATPDRGLERIRLEEQWRMGGMDDDVIFGLITNVTSDEIGNIYFLDTQLCEVQVYTSDGEHLKTLFRRGEGPGELNRPRDLALLGDGSIGVIQEFPGRMIRVDRDNNPLPSVEVHDPKETGFRLLDGAFAGGQTLVFSGTEAERAVDGVQNRTTFLSIYSLEGEEITRLASGSENRDFNNFVLAEKRLMPSYFWANCVDKSGRVYTAADRERYAVEIYSPAGELEKVIEKDYQKLKRPEVDQQRLTAALESVMQGANIPFRVEVEEYEYNIMAMQHGVRVREDGSVWVMPSRGVYNQPAGVMVTFDLFDKNGHFDRQVAIEGEHDPVWDGLFFVGADRMIVVTGHVEAIIAQYGQGTNTYADEEDEAGMEVICYRMIKR